MPKPGKKRLVEFIERQRRIKRTKGKLEAALNAQRQRGLERIPELKQEIASIENQKWDRQKQLESQISDLQEKHSDLVSDLDDQIRDIRATIRGTEDGADHMNDGPEALQIRATIKNLLSLQCLDARELLQENPRRVTEHDGAVWAISMVGDEGVAEIVVKPGEIESE